MKLNRHHGGKEEDGKYILDGMELTGPLVLNVEGVEENEAVSREYVDQLGVEVRAENVTRGTMGYERFPEFTGDLTKEPFSSYIRLVDSGVVPGTYTKVEVNGKGIVVDGGELEFGDIPDFGWEKVSNRPSTLVGYGITDGVNRHNGVVDGRLTSPGHPTKDTEAVTMGYLDSITLVDGGNVDTGDIIHYGGDDTPLGYLRCNGSNVPISEYPELYSVIGDLYTSRYHTGSGNPWQHQYFISDKDPGIDLTWRTPPIGYTIPQFSEYSTMVVTKDRIYSIASASGYSTQHSYTATITEYDAIRGIHGSWSKLSNIIPSLPVEKYISGRSTSVLIGNKLYLFGGKNALSVSSQDSNQILVATINNDGVIGNFSAYGELPLSSSNLVPIITSDRLYLFSGRGVKAGKVWTCTIDQNGDLGDWDVLDGPVDRAEQASVAFLTIKGIYFLSGRPGDREVHFAPLDTDGVLGSWETYEDALPMNGINRPTVFTTRRRVYILSRTNDTSLYTAGIDLDGTVGDWLKVEDAFPVSTTKGNLFAFRGYLAIVTSSDNRTLFATLDDSIYNLDSDYSEYYFDGSNKVSRTEFTLPEYKSIPGAGVYIKY